MFAAAGLRAGSQIADITRVAIPIWSKQSIKDDPENTRTVDRYAERAYFLSGGQHPTLWLDNHLSARAGPFSLETIKRP